jgi:drug/metabolite transporter (DMT)-like permease
MPEQSSNAWVLFALLTVANWGLYGVLLHAGQVSMADPINGRYKAFLWVGIAYFLVAVLAPLAFLIFKQAGWEMPGKGVGLSLLAGVVGALGAFCVLLAFGAKGHPAAVMSIIFAGAPIVNAIVALSLHPPAGGIAAIRWPFFAGIILAAVGGMLVTLYKPGPGKKPPAAPAATQPQDPASASPAPGS